VVISVETLDSLLLTAVLTGEFHCLEEQQDYPLVVCCARRLLSAGTDISTLRAPALRLPSFLVR